MNVPSRCHGLPGPKACPPGEWLTDNLGPERQPISLGLASAWWAWVITEPGREGAHAMAPW